MLAAHALLHTSRLAASRRLAGCQLYEDDPKKSSRLWTQVEKLQPLLELGDHLPTSNMLRCSPPFFAPSGVHRSPSQALHWSLCQPARSLSQWVARMVRGHVLHGVYRVQSMDIPHVFGQPGPPTFGPQSSGGPWISRFGPFKLPPLAQVTSWARDRAFSSLADGLGFIGEWPPLILWSYALPAWMEGSFASAPQTSWVRSCCSYFH